MHVHKTELTVYPPEAGFPTNQQLKEYEACPTYAPVVDIPPSDITATLLAEVNNNVGIEPVLQKLSGEHLTQEGHRCNSCSIQYESSGLSPLNCCQSEAPHGESHR